MYKSKTLVVAVAAATISGLTVVGVASAAMPDASGTIHACVNKLVGSVRVIDTAKQQKCTIGEVPLTWSQSGPAGPSGAPGPTGATGPQGPKGDNGAPGLTWRGGWDGNIDYWAGDVVSFNGSAYVAAANGPAGSPGSDEDWQLLAEKGSDGSDGATGAQGPAGIGGWQELSDWLDLPAGADLTKSVTCPTGKVVLSGGYRSGWPNVQILSNAPDDDYGQDPTRQWAVWAVNNDKTQHSIEVWAVCVNTR